MISILRRWLFGNKTLTDLERSILQAVRVHLSETLQKTWDDQLARVNHIQRLPDGAEINLYSLKRGRPVRRAELAFPNKTEELLLARVSVQCSGIKKTLTASVWCVRGFIFSLEYQGSSKYFEEIVGQDLCPDPIYTCDLMADLSSEAADAAS